MAKKPQTLQYKPPAPLDVSTQTRAVRASTGDDPAREDTVAFVVRRKLGDDNGLTMDCAIARNGVVIHMLDEPVGPGYETWEHRRALRILARLWKMLRAGRGVPWTL